MRTPRTIGRFEVLQVLHDGAFGPVFQGRDPAGESEVSIQLCTLDDAEIRRRFYAEAAGVAKLRHTNVIEARGVGFENEAPFLAEELQPRSLDQVLGQRPPWSAGEKLALLIQVARGMAYAHSRGFHHHDLRPDHVYLANVDGRHVAKVGGLGLARLAAAENRSPQKGVTLATAVYLPPEQVRGGEVDQRVDLFAFGVMAYELLTYERPFQGQNLSALVYQVLYKDPQPMAVAWGDCPAPLEKIVFRCLAKDRDERYESFEALLSDLDGFLRQAHGRWAGLEKPYVAMSRVTRDASDTAVTRSQLARTALDLGKGSSGVETVLPPSTPSPPATDPRASAPSIFEATQSLPALGEEMPVGPPPATTVEKPGETTVTLPSPPEAIPPADRATPPETEPTEPVDTSGRGKAPRDTRPVDRQEGAKEADAPEAVIAPPERRVGAETVRLDSLPIHGDSAGSEKASEEPSAPAGEEVVAEQRLETSAEAIRQLVAEGRLGDAQQQLEQLVESTGEVPVVEPTGSDGLAMDELPAIDELPTMTMQRLEDDGSGAERVGASDERGDDDEEPTLLSTAAELLGSLPAPVTGAGSVEPEKPLPPTLVTTGDALRAIPPDEAPTTRIPIVDPSAGPGEESEELPTIVSRPGGEEPTMVSVSVPPAPTASLLDEDDELPTMVSSAAPTLPVASSPPVSMAEDTEDEDEPTRLSMPASELPTQRLSVGPSAAPGVAPSTTASHGEVPPAPPAHPPTPPPPVQPAPPPAAVASSGPALPSPPPPASAPPGPTMPAASRPASGPSAPTASSTPSSAASFDAQPLVRQGPALETPVVSEQPPQGMAAPTSPVGPTSTAPAERGGRGMVFLLVAAVAAVLVVAGALWWLWGRGAADEGPTEASVTTPPPPTVAQPAPGEPVGRLAVTAAPWARVVEITDSAGFLQDLPDDRHTPLVLELAPGSYRITLQYGDDPSMLAPVGGGAVPDDGGVADDAAAGRTAGSAPVDSVVSSDPQTCEVVVTPSAVARCDMVFEGPDALDYFKEAGWWQ